MDILDIGNLLSTSTINPTVNTIAFPNPFSDTFKLSTSVIGDVDVKVYDMTGRLVESGAIKSEDIAKQEWGTNYKAGIYTMVVTQGSNQQTLRVIKN